MKRSAIAGLILSSTALFSGCATIVSGTDQKLTFDSEPEGATVTVAGRVLGKTPLTVEVDKDKNLALTFEKEGYKTYTTQLSTSLEPWFWGNIVIGGLVGSTTDSLSGAIHEYSPDQYYVTLVSTNEADLSKADTSKVREFVVAFGQDIRAELSGQVGEKVTALTELLGTDVNDTTTLSLAKLAEENENDLDFANKLIELYEIK